MLRRAAHRTHKPAIMGTPSTPDASLRQMPFRLDDRVALITGAGSERGIGRAIATVFAAAGAKVGLVDMYAACAEHNAAELRAAGNQAFGTGGEVTDAESVHAAVARVEAALGPVDVLVN